MSTFHSLVNSQLQASLAVEADRSSWHSLGEAMFSSGRLTADMMMMMCKRRAYQLQKSEQSALKEVRNGHCSERSQERILLARRQQLRERDPDLRALLRRLQSEYVGKELEQQIVENQYRKLQIQIESINNDKFVNDALSNDTEEVSHDEKNIIEKNNLYGRELKQQIQVLQQQRRTEHEADALNEKNMMDDIVRGIQEEDNRQRQEMRDRKQQSQNEMRLFMKSQQDLKIRQKIILAEEEKFLEDQQMKIQDRSNDIFAEKKKKLDIQYVINKRVIDKMLADKNICSDGGNILELNKAAKEERDNLIRNLVEHEHEERNIQQETFQKQKNWEMTTYNRQMLLGQMHKANLLRLQQVQENNLYSEELSKQAAEEQMKKDVEMSTQRARNESYAACLRQQIQANRDKRQKDKEDDIARNISVETHSDHWKRDVDEEKRKIFEEHQLQFPLSTRWQAS